MALASLAVLALAGLALRGLRRRAGRARGGAGGAGRRRAGPAASRTGTRVLRRAPAADPSPAAGRQSPRERPGAPVEPEPVLDGRATARRRITPRGRAPSGRSRGRSRAARPAGTRARSRRAAFSGAVRGVDEVLGGLEREVAADRARRGLVRPGRAVHRPDDGDRVRALEDRRDERRADVMKSTRPAKNGFSRWTA